MSTAPAGVSILATASGEQVRLDPVSRLSEPGMGAGCLALGTIAGSLFADVAATVWAGRTLPPVLAVPAVLVGLLGMMGAAPIVALWVLGRLMTPRRPVVDISPVECRLGRRRVRWGDVDRMEHEGTSIRFHLDGGARVDFPLPCQPRERVVFVHEHLSRRLEQLAPGDPAEVPAALRELR